MLISRSKREIFAEFFIKPIDSDISAVYNDSNNSDISAVLEAKEEIL
nr:MAG TPA: hypothetical protein [Caudoviricetes sp.]DAM33771.1 MAG TPA: hypothetical protein [Caudoviricetes sp.]